MRGCVLWVGTVVKWKHISPTVLACPVITNSQIYKHNFKCVKKLCDCQSSFVLDYFLQEVNFWCQNMIFTNQNSLFRCRQAKVWADKEVTEPLLNELWHGISEVEMVGLRKLSIRSIVLEWWWFLRVLASVLTRSPMCTKSISWLHIID